MPNKRPPAPESKPATALNYIKTKARLLPIAHCLISDTDNNIYTAVIARRHATGNLTYASYLIDKWCCGVIDSAWQFNESEQEFERWCSRIFGSLPHKEISYAEAHNRIYGAIAWAEDAGIEPGQGWAYTQYLMEEDNDDIELIEYPFGDNGRYHFCPHSEMEMKRICPKLNRNIGEGNYLITKKY